MFPFLILNSYSDHFPRLYLDCVLIITCDRNMCNQSNQTFLLSDLWPLFSLGLLFALNSSSITPPLQLTNSALTVSFRDSGAQAGGRDLCASLPQVCADVEVHRGQYYWEVDVCNSPLYRIGKEYNILLCITQLKIIL